MAFLFKSSKKNQDRALAARDGNTGSQSSAQSAAGRMSEKGSAHQRGTPTGSLNSLDNDGTPDSPNRGHGRKGGSIDQSQQLQAQAQIQPQPQQQSDLPVGRIYTILAGDGKREQELANIRLIVS
jgi:hypothetical protein